MKALLVVHPLKEYLKSMLKEDNRFNSFQNISYEELYHKFNEVIDRRYRQKGYSICFLNFQSQFDNDINITPVLGVETMEEDVIIHGTVSYCGYGFPERIENGRMVHNYPDFGRIKQGIGEEINELIIAGFDNFGLVNKLASYFQDHLKINTTVDIEISKMFLVYSKRSCFDQDTYNLANIIEWDAASTLYNQGLDLYRKLGHGFNEDYYHLERYKSTIKRSTVFWQLVRAGREYINMNENNYVNGYKTLEYYRDILMESGMFDEEEDYQMDEPSASKIYMFVPNKKSNIVS